jgi:hypothetical protein
VHGIRRDQFIGFIDRRIVPVKNEMPSSKDLIVILEDLLRKKLPQVTIEKVQISISPEVMRIEILTKHMPVNGPKVT